MRSHSLLSLLLLLTACAIPERDNPHDRSRAPAAVLRVGDATVPGAGCPGLPTSEQPVEVVRASHGRCLVLDASATTDPQADPVSYSYRMTSPRMEEIPGDGTMVRIPSSILADVTLFDVPLEFSVEASDGFAFSSATAHVVLTNSPPTVDPGSPRTIPLNGYPWTWASGDGTIELRFRARAASDPDGDAVVLCWTLPGQAENCTDPEPALSPPPDASVEAAYVAAVRAFDGAAFSAPKPVRVRVGTPSVWLVPDDPFETASPSLRLDALRRVSAVLGTGGNLASAVFAPPDRIVAFRFGGATSTLDVVDWPGAAGIAVTQVPAGYFKGLGASETGTRVWSVTGCDNADSACPNFGASDALFVTAWDVGVATLTSSTTYNVADSLPFEIDRDPAVSVDSSGAAYVSIPLTEVLEYLPVQAAGRATLLSTPGQIFSGHAPRPGTDEVWVLETSAGGVGAEASVAVLSGGVLLRSLPLGISGAFNIAWVGPDEFWTYVPGSGLRLASVSLLELGWTLEEASVLAPAYLGSTFFGGPKLVGNAVTGECWAVGVDMTATALARRDGSVEAFDSTPNQLLFADPAGALWFEQGGGLATGDSPRSDRVARTNPYSSFSPQQDLSTGGVWLPQIIPAAIADVGEDGRLSRYLTRSILADGTTRSLAEPLIVSVHPDGEAAWTLTFDIETFNLSGLERLMLATTSLDALPTTLVYGSAGAAAIRDGGGRIEASAPVPGSPPFLWATWWSGALATIVRIFPDGTQVPSFNVPADESEVHLARSLRDNSLCVVTERTVPTSEAIVRRLTVQGAVTTLGVVPLGAFSRVQVVTVSSSPSPMDEDLCWLALDDGTVLAIGATGTVVSVSFPGTTVSSLFPESRNAFWLSGYVPPNTEVTSHATWNGASWDQTLYGTTDGGQFAMPGGSLLDF